MRGRTTTRERAPDRRAAAAPRTRRAPAGRRRGAAPLTLQQVRELAELTQEQVAAGSGVSQIEISRAEHRADHKLSTLRRYVAALGGELEVWVRVGGRRVRLRDV